MNHKNTFGRYCIKKYDDHLVLRMKAMSRHIYSTSIVNGKRVVYDFEHNGIPAEIIVTDRRIGLASSYDRMPWNVFLETGCIEDNTLVW